MNYELKHFDTTLVSFSATEDTNTPEIKILWKNEVRKELFPIELLEKMIQTRAKKLLEN